MKIWQIELTNHCNFTCVYCPRTTDMKRDGGIKARGVMEDATIDRIAEIAEPGSIIRLHHFGESLLYPEKCARAITKFKERNIRVGINTNGSAASLKNVQRMFDLGLDEMVISYHPLDQRKESDEAESTRHLMKLIENLPQEYLAKIELIRVVAAEDRPRARQELEPYEKLGLRCSYKDLRDSFTEEAKQIQIQRGIKLKGPDKCAYIDNNEFCVLYDGGIVSCCEIYDRVNPFDPTDNWVIGSVFDDELPDNNPGCSRCLGCNGYGNNDEETEKEAI